MSRALAGKLCLLICAMLFAGGCGGGGGNTLSPSEDPPAPDVNAPASIASVDGAMPGQIDHTVVVRGEGFHPGDQLVVVEGDSRTIVHDGVGAFTFVGKTEMLLEVDADVFRTGEREVVLMRGLKEKAAAPVTFLQGPEGVAGAPGPAGPQGDPGASGSMGPAGPAGTYGRIYRAIGQRHSY